MALRLTVDIGASITKAVYNINDQEESFMKMDSECIYAPLSIIERVEEFGKVLPEDSAWISHNKNNDEVCLLGFLAKKIQTRKPIKDAKYKSLASKTLGIIGAIAVSHKLDLKNLELKLNFLIPFDEYSSRKMFIPSLESSLKKFYFKSSEIRSTIREIRCFPEGYGGLINLASKEGGEKWLRAKKIVVLMFGHRNCSFLYFDRGKFVEGDTLNLGFYNFLESIKNYGITQDLKILEQIIPLIGDNLTIENQLFYALTSGQSKKERALEIKQLINVVKKTKEQTWISIQDWLRLKMPKILNEVIVLGGASRYFLKEIKDFCSWSNVYFADDLAEEISQKFPEKIQRANCSFEENDNQLSFRFADVFGLHKYLKNPR